MLHRRFPFPVRLLVPRLEFAFHGDPGRRQRGNTKMAIFEFGAHPNRPTLPLGYVKLVQGLYYINQISLGNSGRFDSRLAVWCQDETVLGRPTNAQSFRVLKFVEMRGAKMKP